jgi:hypothetical protein
LGLVAALRGAGLGLVVDIVPNHAGVGTPAANPAWWDVLRLGHDSAYAHWFDIDWSRGRLLLPILADTADALDDLRVENGELRYYDHRFPLAPGTDGGTPREVHDWWAGLTRAQQLAVVVAAPGLVGNLDGVPARDRHRANTVALDRDLADPDFPWADNARAADEARRLLGSDLAQVLVYDPGAFDGEGRVAISAGDLDAADNVAVLVPGMGTDATSAVDYAERALTLHEAAGVLDPEQTNATLSWIGYDAPDLPQVVREDLAEDGGARLDDTVDGLRAGRAGAPAHLTAIGYSYGSTTLGHGAHDHGLAVDDLVAVGSPGLGGDTDHAGDLGVDPGHVWAGANSVDSVADLGNHGSFHLERFGGLGLGDDPVEDTFGAQRFQAESTTRGTGGPFADHLKYFDHDTESLANLTAIVGRDYAEVRLADHVHDPWFGAPVDPEADRTPTAPDTDGAPPRD